MEAMDVDEANLKIIDTEQLVKQCFGEEIYAQFAASDKIRYRIMCTRYLEDPDIDAETIHSLSAKDINNILIKCFTNEEWTEMSDFRKTSYRVLFTVYVSDPEYAQKYSLKEFLNTKGPKPEKVFKEITGSPKVYAPPQPYDGKFWYGCSSSSGSTSGQSALRKPTLEEMWDASDSEHALEKGVQRERAAEEVLEKRKRGRAIKKKDPPKKRGRKKKFKLKPRLKPVGKPRGRKKKNPIDPKTPATRSKSAPVTRSQARKLEAKNDTAKKIETKSTPARKTETKKTTVKRTKREAEKAEVPTETETKTVPKNVVAKEVIENSDGESTENGEARYAPPAKKRRTPGRRFVPPPPPPCFYDIPPYRRRDSYIDSLTPPLPNPSFRNIEFCSSLQTCKCGPPPPKPRHFSTNIIGLTESSNVSALPQDLLKLCSKMPLLPPPLAPLSNIGSMSVPSNAKPSTDVELSTNTDLGVTVYQKPSSKTTTVYYVPQAIKPADNSDLIISPGFYVPTTLEQLPGQPLNSPNINVAKISLSDGKPATSVGFFVTSDKLQTRAPLGQTNVTEQPPTSTLYVQQMQTQYRDINKPTKTSKSHQSLPVTCSFVPSIQANTTTPYSVTYVNSQPLTSSTFSVPDTPLTVSFTENVNMTPEMKAKIVKIARSSITSIPIIPEREKRMQPKRLVNRKKFIIAPKSRILISDKESNPPVSRPFQDLTKSLENRQNIEAGQSQRAFLKVGSNMVPRQENKPNIIKTIGTASIGIRDQEKRPAEIKVFKTKSSATNASAEIKPIITKAKPQIKIPPHVKPCPTHCPTRSFLTTSIKEKINPIVRPKLEPKTAAPSEVFVSLSESQVLTFQEAQAEAFSTLTRPLTLGNIGPVPVQATYVQQQLKTYSGPGKRGRFISSGPSKIIAKTEVKTIKAPIIQVPIFKMPAGRAPPPLILQSRNIQIPVNLTENQEGLIRQLPVIQPLVSLYPGVKSALNKPPEKFGKRPFQTDSSASASDDDEEIITIEFPPSVDQRQIQALSSAQPIKPESIQYVTTHKYTVHKAGQPKLVKVPKLQGNPPDTLKSCPAKKGQTPYKAIAPKIEQTTSTLKTPITTTTTKKKIKTILPKPVQMSSKSAGLNYSIINYTESQITTTTAKSQYTLSTSKPPYFTVTTRAQITKISTGCVQTLSTTKIKNIGVKIGQTRSFSTSTDMIVTTRPQISTCLAKTVQIPSKPTATVVNQPQIKTGVPIKVLQTLCTLAQTTQTVTTIFTNTKMVQTTNMSSMSTQLSKIPRIEVISGDKAIEGSDTIIQKSDTTIQKSDTTIQKSDKTIQKSDTTIQKSDTAIQKSDTTIQQSDPKIQTSDTTIQNTIQKSDTTTAKSDTTTPESDTTIPMSDMTIKRSDTTIPKSDTTILKSDTTIPKSDTIILKSDTTIPKSDTTIQKLDNTIQKSDTTIQKSDTVIQKSDTTIQQSDTTIQQSDTKIQTSDTTILKSGTTIPKSDMTIPRSDTTISKSDTTIPKSDTALQGSGTEIQKSDTQIQMSDTQIQMSDTQIQRSSPKIQGSGTKIQMSVTTVQSDTAVQEHIQPTQIKQGPTVLPISTKDQSGTVKKSAGRDRKIKGSSPQRATLPRRRGRPSILATVMPIGKFAETQSKVSKRPALHPVKVANFQRLISEVQKSVALSKDLKEKALTAEKAATAESTESALLTDQDQNLQTNVSQTSALATTSGTSTYTAIPPLKNIKILTPIRTSTGEILTNDSLSVVRTLSTQSGATRISLVKPGIYQVVHTTSTGHSEPKLYTANEMLAAEVLSNDLKRNLRKVIYKRVKQDANSTTTIVTITNTDDATSTSATSTASTSSLADEETPELEETPKFDEPDTGN